MHAPGQWETTLQCNVVSHWLGTCKKWSLGHPCFCQPRCGCHHVGSGTVDTASGLVGWLYIFSFIFWGLFLWPLAWDWGCPKTLGQNSTVTTYVEWLPACPPVLSQCSWVPAQCTSGIHVMTSSGRAPGQPLDISAWSRTGHLSPASTWIITAMKSQ